MASYADQFRLLFTKKEKKIKREEPPDDQEILYIKNPKKYCMMDLNDWFNIQQKQIEKYALNPPDKSMRNCEVITHEKQLEEKKSHLYLSSPLNELFPLKKNHFEKDKVVNEEIESKKKKEDDLNNDTLPIINLEDGSKNNKDEEAKVHTNKEGIKDEEETKNRSNKDTPEINLRENKKNCNVDISHQEEEEEGKTPENIKQKKDISLSKKENFLSNDIDLNITQGQMKDFKLEVNRIENKIIHEAKKFNLKLRDIKSPAKHKKLINNEMTVQFIHNNNNRRKESNNNSPSQLENDDSNRFSTQIILNDSHIPLSLKFTNQNIEPSQDYKSLNYNSSFSTQIPYQMPVINPIYHYGDFETKPLIKRMKLFRQQSVSNIIDSNQQASRLNEQYQQMNRHRSFSPQSNDHTAIKKTNAQFEIKKSKKELLYNKELEEELNKLNEQYIARYRKLHSKDIKNPKKQKDNKLSQCSKIKKERILDNNNNSCEYNNISIPPPIKKRPLYHSASQVYYNKINIQKNNDELHHFLFQNRLKGLFEDYQTFNSKIAQIRSLLKK